MNPLSGAVGVATLAMMLLLLVYPATAVEPRPQVKIRGVYGGVPEELLPKPGQAKSETPLVNAVWVGSGGMTPALAERLHALGVKAFAEFNTMHEASYLKDHPDAAPIGTDGKVCPAPSGWQGVCPTHPGYRKAKMDAFRKLLAEVPVDGVWLDYHHSHASWEQAVPQMPDTCFCPRCLSQFEKETGLDLPDAPTAELSARLLGPLRETWVNWRCGVFTDWVREFRDIRNATRPGALLGTFHCPWSDRDFDGALRDKLAIDLKAQAKLVDVLSPMPYHARFGHATDPAWVSRQLTWLGDYLGLKGADDERPRVWPIVQLSDWGETVPASQVAEVLDHGTRPPATGVMTFVWGALQKSPEKVDAMARTYRAIRP